VDVFDDVGTGFNQILIAAFQLDATEIRSGDVANLEHGSHGPVEDKDAGGESVGKSLLA